MAINTDPIPHPAPKTLAKYGLTLGDWMDFYSRAGGVCEICGVKTKRLCVDHEHVRGYSKMPPNERRKRVRGVLCWRCNVQLVGRSVTVTKLRSAAAYLERYHGSDGYVVLPPTAPRLTSLDPPAHAELDEPKRRN